jgi:predicted nucleotidyltransferase
MVKMNKLFEDLKKLIYPDFEGFLERLNESDKIISLILVGSYSRNEERVYSDIDLAIIVEDGFKEKYVQVLHYFGEKNFLDLMIFEENEILKNTRPRLFGVILRNGRIVFCKNKNLLDSLNKIISSKKSFKNHPYEIESIWFRLFWRLKKIESYLKIDKDIAELVALQTHVFIGLMFSKLNNVENYSYTSNLKYMKKEHPKFWKDYLKVIKNPRCITNNLKKIITQLPDFEKYKRRKSLMELDNFLSPITVLEGKMGVSKIKTYLDKIILN